MNKVEWGIKRICLDCNAIFYDLKKNPITCPSCSAIFDPEYILKKKFKNLEKTNEIEVAIDIDENDANSDEDETIEEIDSEETDGTPLKNEKK